jgi:hypothetical protein
MQSIKKITNNILQLKFFFDSLVSSKMHAASPSMIFEKCCLVKGFHAAFLFVLRVHKEFARCSIHIGFGS